MRTIGAFEAKTHLSEILERAAQGEETLVTRRGIPIAKIIPFNKSQNLTKENTILRLKNLRKNLQLRNFSWKELRDQGRR
ncbi:MAG TPA: type II toxin-antitoxin system prevent-host-death family antitoxin [Alphaproteobacteria bacterium]|jgi:prevent-host-death family protein|nr:type II toxin-antitoxin system prevent-host-death family antitoxin [Alphaproteobacteria bacterium]MBX7147422.1 type II toxin-antitoxin system prevent-host-death family antitoxin [Alphaproteobacteria bacterium]HMS44669.1 type II toxin-antitoxin system prevent-host-death family antitoxin [Alphaproteobacteria bacterium]